MGGIRKAMAAESKETALFNAYLGLGPDEPKFTLTRTQSQPPLFLNYPPPPTSPLHNDKIVHIPSKVKGKVQLKEKQQKKRPKFVLRRQKTEGDIHNDLNALPLTPPFAATQDADILSLGLPQNLSYSKTT